MAKSAGLNYNQINQVLSQCDLVESTGILASNVRETLRRNTSPLGISVEYGLGSLLAAISALAQKSTIQSLKLVIGSSMYIGLVAPASSGKSAAIEMIMTAVDKTEQALKIENSILINAPTVESLAKCCQEIPSILSLFDEANTFFGALGRYTKGDVAYDKAMYNTLWTTPSLYTRTTSTHKLRLKNPRFNMAFATHADATIKLLTAERVLDDGFSHRLLIYAPPDEADDGEAIMSAENPDARIHSIVLFTYLTHMVARHYTFTPEAEAILIQEYNRYKQLKQRAKRCDYTLLSMFGKCLTILVRNAMVLQILHFSIHYVSSISGASDMEIRPSFIDACRKVVNKLPSNTFVIDKLMLTRAINLLGYWNRFKLLFFGYTINPRDEIAVVFERLLEEASEKLEKIPTLRTTANEVIPIEVLSKMQKILRTPKSDIWPRMLDKGNDHVRTVMEAMNHLAAHGFGTTTTFNAKNGRQVQHFYKIKSNELQKNPVLMDKIQELGVPIKLVLKAMNDGELEESLTTKPPQATKRNASEMSQDHFDPINTTDNVSANSMIDTAKMIDLINKNHGGLPTQITKERFDRIISKAFVQSNLLYVSDSDDESGVASDTNNSNDLRERQENVISENHNPSSPLLLSHRSQAVLNENSRQTVFNNQPRLYESPDEQTTDNETDDCQNKRNEKAKENPITCSQRLPSSSLLENIFYDEEIENDFIQPPAKKSSVKGIRNTNQNSNSASKSPVNLLPRRSPRNHTNVLANLVSNAQTEKKDRDIGRKFVFTKPTTEPVTTSCTKGDERTNGKSSSSVGSKKPRNGVQQRQIREYEDSSD